jgi:hypothetical protein
MKKIIVSMIFLILLSSSVYTKYKSIYPDQKFHEYEGKSDTYYQDVKEYNDALESIPKYSQEWRTQKSMYEKRLKAIYKIKANSEIPGYYSKYVQKDRIQPIYTVKQMKDQRVVTRKRNSNMSFQEMVDKVSSNVPDPAVQFDDDSDEIRILIDNN